MSSASANDSAPLYAIAAMDLKPNRDQWDAYESTGNCIVLAGPGSGKTKTLTVKMARMLSEDITTPRAIACITYNNQCVRELRRRLETLGIEESESVSISTLHSFCLHHIVLPYAYLGGIPLKQPVLVASTQEVTDTFEAALKKVIGLSENPRDWKTRFETYRRTHLDRNSKSWREDDEDVALVIEEYEARLADKGIIDFDSMVLYGLRLVEEHDSIRDLLCARFPILVVDEYQDLGHALHRLVLALCFKGNIRLLAVGDPDQSIYGFTGADPSLLQSLASRQDVSTVRLKLNYRCGQTIIAASEIALGETRGFTSGANEAGTIDFYKIKEGLVAQAAYVCNTIVPKALSARQGRSLGDIAVLYRTQHEGDVIAAAVEDKNWPFIRFDQGNPYPRSPVIYWLEDCAAWCAGGWGRGTPRLSELVTLWLRFNESATAAIDKKNLTGKLVSFLDSHKTADLSVFDWLKEFRKQVLDATLNIEPRLREDLTNVNKLEAVTAPGARLESFTISMFGGQAGSKTHLQLMTFHSAKGLEFDVVAMIGLEEGKVPDYRSNGSEIRMKEERRLFYVGVTRARHEVHLLCSGWYEAFNRRFEQGCSRFVKELYAALRPSKS